MVWFDDESDDFCMVLPSGLNNALPVDPGEKVEVVGDAKTSVNLEGGSLRESLFQIPLPQGNELDPAVAACPRPPTPGFEADVWLWEPHVPESAEGVLGWEVVGDIELLANDPFLGWPPDCVVSFSQEARRVGFCGGTTVCWWSDLWISASSSELARASESGVERLALNFSSNMDGLFDVRDEGLGWIPLTPVELFALIEVISVGWTGNSKSRGK
jgi:hypothetical protein